MEKRKYHNFGKKILLQNLILFLPLALLFWLAWTHFDAQDFVLMASIMLLVIGSVGGLIWNRMKTISIHCPQCKTFIKHPIIRYRKAGDPINFYCPNCDIEWETGLSEGGADG